MWDGKQVGDEAVSGFKEFVTNELSLESDKRVNIIVSSAEDFLGERPNRATVSQFFPARKKFFRRLRSSNGRLREGPRLVASS